jgi:hypothetical protein
MNTKSILGLSAFALALAIPTAQAEDRAQPAAARLGEHPAVTVARRGVQADPTSNFYLHPARLSWSLQRPVLEDQPLQKIAASGGQDAANHP